MTDLFRIRLRTLIWLLLFPGTFLVLLPCWLHRRIDEPFAWGGTPGQWLGIWLLLNGAGLTGWCVNLFNVQGRGTPLPLDPPKRFVASGPYRFTRNPMMLGLWLILAGEALLYRSQAVGVYLGVMVVLGIAFVRFVEEPELGRRFGASYTVYRRQVPRWFPRSISGVRKAKTR